MSPLDVPVALGLIGLALVACVVILALGLCRAAGKPQPHTCPTCHKYPASAHTECPNCRAAKLISRGALDVEMDEFLTDPTNYRRQG